MSFLSIYYDSYKNKLYHRYLNPETNKMTTDVVTPKYEYYIKDKTGKSDMFDVFGNPVVKKETDNRDGIKSIISSGIVTYETDINQDLKFLNKEYGKKILSVDMNNFNVCNLDIEISVEDVFPDPEKANFPINAITLKNSKNKQIYTFGLYDYTGNSDTVKNYLYCPDEKTLLEKFIMFFRKCKFQIITGWNICVFDIPYLINRMEKLGVDYSKLSPHSIVTKKRGYEEYTIAGIAQLDYMKLYKRFTFTDRESYSLNFISKYEKVGGKLDYEGTINDLWKNDWNKFIEYNIQDVLLVDKLDLKLRFIELAISICYDSLIPFEQVFSTIPMHMGYCLKFLHNKNMVMPVKIKSEHQSFPGAYVYNKLGMHNYVVSFDIQSLYPTLIRQFNIGPDTLVKDPKNTEGLIKTPISKYKDWETNTNTFKDIGGIYYRNDKKSVLAEIVESIFFGRIRDKNKKSICDFVNNGISDKEIQDVLKLNEENELSILKQEIEIENGNSNFYDNRQLVRKIQMNCFHKDTDILTKDGIKKLKDVKVGDIVYSINKENGNIELKPVEKTYEYDFDGELIRIKNTNCNLAITDEHKLLEFKDHKINTILAKDFIKSKRHIMIFGDYDSYELDICENEDYSKEYYCDKVYNLTVADNHTVCVGENGKFMWTGQSLYGALGTPHFPFYNLNNAMAITLSGQTLIRYLTDNTNKYLKMKYDLKNDIPVLCDTDSNYLCFDEIIKKLDLNFETNQDFLNWVYDFIENTLDPFYDKILDIFAEKYGVKQLIKFKREKIAKSMLVLEGKKKYALEVLDNEGKVYEEPQIKVTGIEVVRTSTPSFCRNKLKESLSLIFKTKDKDTLMDFIREIKKAFNKEAIENISFPRGVSDYKKYAKSIDKYLKDGITYEKGIPIANRASINYNYLVKRFGLKNQLIDDGSKIKFIYVKSDNLLNQNVIAYIGNYPDKFKELFEIDYNRQFESSFQDVIQRFFDVLGWGEINFASSKLSKFFN